MDGLAVEVIGSGVELCGVLAVLGFSQAGGVSFPVAKRSAGSTKSKETETCLFVVQPITTQPPQFNQLLHTNTLQIKIEITGNSG